MKLTGSQIFVEVLVEAVATSAEDAADGYRVADAQAAHIRFAEWVIEVDHGWESGASWSGNSFRAESTSSGESSFVVSAPRWRNSSASRIAFPRPVES